MIARKFPVTDYKSKDSRWNIYYKEFHMEQYLKTLEYDDVTLFINNSTIDIKKDVKILDIGCGSGRHSIHLFNNGFMDISAIDLSLHGINNLKKHCPGIKTGVADATNLPFKANSFDIVVMVGIVYEIPESRLHDKLFSEIERVLKSGGKLLFVNNSPYNLGERIFTITQRIQNIFLRKRLRFFVWRYGRSDVKRLLHRNNLKLIKAFPCNQYRGVYRFCYGIFVPRSIKRKRTERMVNTNANPYTLHEYYLVNKQHDLLTPLGRFLAKFSIKRYPYLFANTIGYYCIK